MLATTTPGSQWHAGTKKLQQLLKAPVSPNIGVSNLTPQASYFLESCPIVVLGTLSLNGAPWVSLLGGEPGFAQGIGDHLLSLRSNISIHDPIFENLQPWHKTEEEKSEGAEGLVAGLAINLAERRRLKLNGRVGRDMKRIEQLTDSNDNERHLGMVINLQSTLFNCPKYLNQVLHPYYTTPEPITHPSPLPFPPAAIDLIVRSSVFFVASRNGFESMDVNHRGGPEGFVRVVQNDLNGTSIIWPEYSGNRLYFTLGNFHTTPVAGLTFPDFTTGDILYLTGTVETLIGKAATNFLPRSNLAVKMTVTAARFVQKGLGIRGELGEFSPYNPPVRYLKTERADPVALTLATRSTLTARLSKATKLTSDLARFNFQLLDKNRRPSINTWKAGQYIALSFADELNVGYRHMDDSDPSGLNDDYTRTWTISSPPKAGEFDIIMRKVGTVSEFLFNARSKSAMELSVLGIAGDMFIDPNKDAYFIAGGIGITPFLAQYPSIKDGCIELFWTVKECDIPFVRDVLFSSNKIEGMAKVTNVFVTGVSDADQASALTTLLEDWGVKSVHVRRLAKKDLNKGMHKNRKWYICANDRLRREVLIWLEKEEVLYEDFGY